MSFFLKYLWAMVWKNELPNSSSKLSELKPKVFYCPHCAGKIEAVKTWDCPSDSPQHQEITRPYNVFRGCPVCGEKVQRIGCPHCRRTIDLENDSYNEELILHRGKRAVTRKLSYLKRVVWSFVPLPTVVMFYLRTKWGITPILGFWIIVAVYGVLLFFIWKARRFYSFENPYEDPAWDKKGEFNIFSDGFTNPLNMILAFVVLMVSVFPLKIFLDHYQLPYLEAQKTLHEEFDSVGYPEAWVRIRQMKSKPERASNPQTEKLTGLFFNYPLEKDKIEENFEKVLPSIRQKRIPLEATLQPQETFVKNIKVGYGKYYEAECEELCVVIGDRYYCHAGNKKNILFPKGLREFNLLCVSPKCDIRIWEIIGTETDG